MASQKFLTANPETSHLLGMEAAKKDDEQDYNQEKQDQKNQEATDTIKHWFTWEFWRLVVYCVIAILAFSEVVTPVVFGMIGLNLLVASGLFFVQNIVLLVTAICFIDGKAAGSNHILSLAIVMAALSLLMFLGALSLKFKKMNKSAQHMCDDLSLVFRPFSILIVVFLVVNAVLEETGSEWGNLALLLSMVLLGLAFAMSGVIKDMMSYVFIRTNDYFGEGDFVHYGGGVVQVKNVYWCHTVVFNPKTKSPMYVPNSKLAAGINNQSRDNARVFETDFAIGGGLPVEKAETIVKEFWKLLHNLEGGFTGLNGRKYSNQIIGDKCAVFLTGNGGNVHVKLAGKYFFSVPPQWNMDGVAEPEITTRQQEWKAGWDYQMEWFILAAKKIVASHTA